MDILHSTLNTEGRKYPYFYLEVNLSVITAHIHPQQSGWEMRALSTWKGLVKDFIPTVYPHGSAEKTLDINLSGSRILPHTPKHHPVYHIAVLMGWQERKRNLISKLTKSLVPLEALGKGGLYRVNIHWEPTAQALQSKGQASGWKQRLFFLFCCSIKW